ncbi:PE-PPE domain-containing protein [Gordonia sp. NB41Y]|uniref:PE-PPE domain-containing protein n=1 Tax=Gordonia sp. NB41Y TaxID=875808 RepID=UPI0002BE4FC0|nr:PE-PPE domain-containing protein [Gordonia sp. NB41Y]WLP91248.1 PE-PPE domain-containing protein [Gordonia sp. NB41Y]
MSSNLIETAADGNGPSPVPAAGPISVLVVGGTGESYSGDVRTQVTGLLEAVTDVLDDRFRARWVGYPASYGPAPTLHGMSYEQSVATGVDALTGALGDSIGPVVLIGYSQGAVVIRRVVAALWGSASPRAAVIRRRILAVGLVADPHQPPGVVPGCRGWGVAGPGPAIPADLPIWWVGAADDMICNAASDSYFRDVADLTGALALPTTRRWLGVMWRSLRANAFQNAERTRFGPRQWRRDVGRLASARREVLGYLPPEIAVPGVRLHNRRGGRHTSYAAEPYRRAPVTDPETTGCQALAGWLQVQATFAGAQAVSSDPIESRDRPRSATR